MEAYTTPSPEDKSHLAPVVPRYRWNYEQRSRHFGERNPAFASGSGRRRRWRRELSTRDGLATIEAVLRNARSFGGRVQLRHSWREMMYGPLSGRRAPVVYARERLKTLMHDVRAHGPASGWGIPQPIRGERQMGKWTPYVVPKRGEACWRWWRARVRALLRLLQHLDALWSQPVPSHRTASSTTPGEKPGEVLGAVQTEARTGYRDRFAERMAALDERMRRHLGM